MGVESLSGEAFALLQDIVVQIGQNGRIVADTILNEQNHLHACLLDVMLQVHLVLYQLDDGKNQVGIAQPTEYIVEHREVFVLHTAGNAMRKGGEHHTGDIRRILLHLARHVKCVVVCCTRHADDQVDGRTLQYLIGFLSSTHLTECGRIAQSQIHILVEDFLIHSSVVFEHKGIIGIGHNQHIEDAPGHQIDKRHIFQIKFIPLLGYLCFHSASL